jgi:hypothetical protein
MSEKPHGGAAFPMVSNEGTDSSRHFTIKRGMSLRDYFAAKVLSGMMADGDSFRTVMQQVGPRETPTAKLAAIAYSIADAMIAERDK